MKESLAGRGDGVSMGSHTAVSVGRSFGSRKIRFETRSALGWRWCLQANDSAAFVAETHAGKAEVRELDVAISANEHVVRFEVPVDDAMGVEVLDCEDELCNVHHGHLWGDSAQAVQQ